MPNSMIHPDEGWISVQITKEYEQRAREFRAKRDEEYRNIYDAVATDERWVGDLGEWVFNSWLKDRKAAGEWITESAAGKADFILSDNIRVGVKTVKRKVPPRSGYTAQITARHTDEPIDFYFFMTYEFNKKLMWMLGAVSKSRFLKDAKYYAAGEQVHPHYTVRQGHEIFNIEIDKLECPDEWLANIR